MTLNILQHFILDFDKNVKCHLLKDMTNSVINLNRIIILNKMTILTSTEVLLT